MSELYKNKYKTDSLRLQSWDYSWNGCYFITICTQDRVPYFGTIEEGKQNLSEIGGIANSIWQEIPKQFSFTQLGNHIIMPDHMRGVIKILNHKKDVRDTDQNKGNDLVGGVTGKHNPMLHENLGRIIRWYKGRVAFEVRKKESSLRWQFLYYDRIIRDEKEYANVENYIRNNPINWKG